MPPGMVAAGEPQAPFPTRNALENGPGAIRGRPARCGAFARSAVMCQPLEDGQ